MKLRYTLLFALSMACVALAVPRAPSPSKYESLKRDSPFTEKPIVTRESKAPQPGLEKDWFIASIAKTVHGDEVILAKKSERSERMRFGGIHGKGPSGHSVVSIKRGKSYKEDEVVISHGGRTSTLRYDVAVAKTRTTPQGQRARAPKNQTKPRVTPASNSATQPSATPPTPVIPGLNNNSTSSSEPTTKRPRVRYVPPAKSPRQ